MNQPQCTSVPKNPAVPMMSAQRVKPAPIQAVTLHTSTGYPLFRSTVRAWSPQEAISQAQAAYTHFLVGIGEQRDLREDAADLVPDAARTLVVPCRGPERCQIGYFVRIAGEEREDDAARLAHGDAIALLREVIDADRRMLKVLTAGRTIDLCPAHTWSSSTGWITVDCAFRAPDVAGRLYALRPTSPALRMAVRLVVLRHLLGPRETVRQPLALRWSADSYSISSATLRAARLMRGPRRPDALIAWLRARGHAAIAEAIEHETRW